MILALSQIINFILLSQFCKTKLIIKTKLHLNLYTLINILQLITTYAN